MLVVGWQKNANHIAYAGINKCVNCKNYSHFAVYELATEATLYWAPLFKVKSRILSVCEICNAAFEIDSKKRVDFLAHLSIVPPKYAFEAIWCQLTDQFNSFLNRVQVKDGLTQPVALKMVEVFADRMAREYDSERGHYVLGRFVQHILDQDKPA